MEFGKLKEYTEPLSDLEKLTFLRDSVNSTIRNLKSKEKATKAEYEFGFNRVGVRGGKYTSLEAKSMNTTKAYLDGVDLIKNISKLI